MNTEVTKLNSYRNIIYLVVKSSRYRNKGSHQTAVKSLVTLMETRKQRQKL